jgi:hypothetical protein
MPFNFDTLELSVGSHEPDGEACAMEAVSQLAGLPWTDHPSCTATDIATYVREINDVMPARRRTKSLKPLLQRLTCANGGNVTARCFSWADAAIHIFAPPTLDATGHPELRNHAKALRGLPTISDSDSCKAAYKAAATAANAAARSAATVAAFHAYSAAYAAADAAAHAGRAARSTANDSAYNAGHAARAAAEAAAHAAYSVAAADKIWRLAVKILKDAIQEAQA